MFILLLSLVSVQLYLWPFAEAVQAGVGSLMCSYNKINQTQACQNSKLLNGVLKEELGFQGEWAGVKGPFLFRVGARARLSFSSCGRDAASFFFSIDSFGDNR
jgi:hypothetical protein